ncbi:hypothetical protein [Methylobacterium nodulans]|uniref:Uncharacterized protein n=1 Tax=Methylobacterium nodulans (strain LMG 21967 / CNCM I-2342 / ORS 2060) TaxID=460265 RepID=B8IAT8_METNO|nr:hypothetical protein [Methylobacterium nodulans]ACL61133.1 conserved hypothetical protein [Methylobacterium nodulans ORS 2060]
MQDRTSPPLQVDQQLQRVLAASLALAEQTALLGLALQIAWLEAWIRPILQASDAYQSWRAQQERRARLVRRGIPDQLARQSLRLVEQRRG